MVVLVSCKNEEDLIKNEGTRVVTTLIIDFSAAQGQLSPKSVMESCQNSNSSKLLWKGLLLARMKKFNPKMTTLELSQYFSHYKSMGIFPDAQGQLTHKSLVRSCRISNPFKMLWLFMLPARIKKIQSKMKHGHKVFPIITLWELSVAMETRVLVQSGPKSNAVNSPP